MIVGIGTDIVQIPRIEKSLEKYGERFINKILNETEIKRMHQLNILSWPSYIAKRFAAKEAVSKALGTGIRGKINFKDIIITNDLLGKPLAKINNKEFDSYKIDLSLADDYPTAIAFTIISK